MPERTRARTGEASAASVRLFGQQHTAASKVRVLVADFARSLIDKIGNGRSRQRDDQFVRVAPARCIGASINR